MMKNKLHLLMVAFAAILISGPLLHAQDGSAYATEKEDTDESIVRFNGLGRTILQNTELGGKVLDTDSSSVRRQVDGEFLLDLQINAQPNDKTEVQSILRLRNEFGGFFGAGMSVEVRELWAAGVIANAVKYRVGDMDVAMTPYTFYNFDEEGFVNNPAAFQPQQDVIHYEQFYGEGNTRRVQGAKLDFGLNFSRVLKDADFSAFIARVRGTDFFTIPTRFTSGAHAKFSTRSLHDSLGIKADFGFNFVHTFDDLRSVEGTQGIRNTIGTFNWDLRVYKDDNIAVHVLGETGWSLAENKTDSLTLFDIDGAFIDIGAKVMLRKQKMKIYGSFVDVGPDFFSIAAQSRRIDYENERTYYDRLGADQGRRPVSNLFDITRDRSLYTFELQDDLMPYDPRFSNTLPYGMATPNRRGVRLGVEQGGTDDKVEGRIDAALMSELRGQGTEELKNFTLVRAAANVNVNQFIDVERKLRVTLGYQYENTQRGGGEFEKVDLQSNLIELGIEAEIFTGFDLLLGAKFLTAEGNEYLPRIGEFNEVIDFPNRFEPDDRDRLLAAGFKYTFKEGVYITLQYHAFTSEMGQDNPNDFNLNQVFVIYNMLF
jgi:hypothetical protein